MRALVLLLLLLLGCGDSNSADDPGGQPPLSSCATDLDCPLGLRCESSECVDETGLRPEQPEPLSFREPIAVGGRLLILSSDGNFVSILDPIRRSIRSVTLPQDPVDIAPLPDGQSAAILSRASRTLSVMDLSGDPSISRLHVGRTFEKLAVSAGGRWALLWTPDGVFPSDGTEGLVALVDLEAPSTPPVEKVLGRRHAAAFFRGADDVVIVAQGEVGIFEVEGFGTTEERGERLALPESHTEPSIRQVRLTPDGSTVLIQSLVSPDLIRIDVPSRTLTTLPLPGTPSSLALADDGTRVVAMLRDVGEAVWFDLLPGGGVVELRSASALLPRRECETAPCLHPAGNVSLSQDGRWAALSTTAADVAAFAALDLESGDVTIVPNLQKLVQRIALSPEGRTALVFHRAEPDPTIADPYEREVRRSQGYSVVALDTGTAQLQLSGSLAPEQSVFAPGGRTVAVTLVDQTLGRFRVDAVDRVGLLSRPHPLASAPEHLGVLEGETVWITQSHPLGRISFVDLLDGETNTLTGFALNGEIE